MRTTSGGDYRPFTFSTLEDFMTFKRFINRIVPLVALITATLLLTWGAAMAAYCREYLTAFIASCLGLAVGMVLLGFANLEEEK